MRTRADRAAGSDFVLCDPGGEVYTGRLHLHSKWCKQVGMLRHGGRDVGYIPV